MEFWVSSVLLYLWEWHNKGQVHITHKRLAQDIVIHTASIVAGT